MTPSMIFTKVSKNHLRHFSTHTVRWKKQVRTYILQMRTAGFEQVVVSQFKTHTHTHTKTL